MEKTADYQITVYNESGNLKIRLNGGQVLDYDNRFGDLNLNEGESRTFPLED